MSTEFIATSCNTPDITCVKDHLVNQGFRDRDFHDDAHALYRFSGTRWNALNDWLDDHDDVKHFWVLDDEPCPWDMKYYPNGTIITTNMDHGFDYLHYLSVRDQLKGLVDNDD
jgi:hypothetical protein